MFRYLVTLYFRPPLSDFGLLDFAAGDTITALGYHYAKDKIAAWQRQTRCQAHDHGEDV